MEDVSLLFGVAGTGCSRPELKIDDIKLLPIGILEDDGSVPIRQDVRQALQLATEALRSEGFTIQPFRSRFLKDARRLWWTFFMRCGRLLLEPALAEWNGAISPTFQYYLNKVRAETLLGAGELLGAWGEADQLRIELEAELAQYAAVLSPVASIAAFQHGERTWIVDGRPLEYFEAMSFMQWINLLGSPAAVVPIERNAAGLPVGVQVAAGSGKDEEVLAISCILDRAFGYRPPPMSRGEGRA